MESTRRSLAVWRQRREHALKMLDVKIPSHVDSDMETFFAPVYSAIHNKLADCSRKVMELEEEFGLEIAYEIENPR